LRVGCEVAFHSDRDETWGQLRLNTRNTSVVVSIEQSSVWSRGDPRGTHSQATGTIAPRRPQSKCKSAGRSSTREQSCARHAGKCHVKTRQRQLDPPPPMTEPQLTVATQLANGRGQSRAAVVAALNEMTMPPSVRKSGRRSLVDQPSESTGCSKLRKPRSSPMLSVNRAHRPAERLTVTRYASSHRSRYRSLSFP